VARVAAPLVVAAVLVVLVVGAISRIGPASGPARRTVDRSFAVLAAPIAEQSNASGAALRAVVVNGPTMSRTGFFTTLNSLATAAAAQAAQFATLTPPVPTDDVAGLCGGALEERARAVGQVRGAFETLLGGVVGRGGGNEAKAAGTVVSAGVLLRSADDAWAGCRRTLRRGPGSAGLPVSVWVRDQTQWTSSSVGTLVASLVSSASLAVVHHLTLLTLSTDPATVPGPPGVGVLPPTGQLQVTVVVANQGNVEEKGVTVVVSAVPQGSSRAPSRREVKTDIAVGDSVALSPPPLAVRQGTSYVLTITATPPAPGVAVSTSETLHVAVVPTTTTTTTTTTEPTKKSGTGRSTTTTAPAPTTSTTRPG
jgi:hypothetical protein